MNNEQLRGSSCYPNMQRDRLHSCAACDCDTTGAVNKETCLAFGGQCLCQPGVTGNRCDRCMNGWFGFSTGVCQGELVRY